MHRLIVNISSTALLCLLSLASAVDAAQSTEPPRVRWEHAAGFVMQSRHWEEKTGNNTFSLVETARNPVFVELSDPTREYTIRLYDDKMLIRGGNNATSGTKIIKFAKRAEGKWTNGSARTKWAYPDGSLDADGEAWFEPAAHRVNLFTERTRNAEFVELHDSLRDYTIRLTAVAMQLRGGNLKDFTKIHEGRWTAVAPPAQIKMTVDVSEAPNLRDWAFSAKELAERWYPIITQRISPNSSPAPRNYKLVFKREMKTPAVTVWGAEHKMQISASQVEKHPDDLGMVVHELTHAIQEYDSNKTKGTTWLAEGIADYARDFEYEPEKPLAPSANKTYRDGYKTTAMFLNWVVMTYDQRLIERLHARLLAGTYTDGVFRDVTGHTVDELWAEYQKQR